MSDEPENKTPHPQQPAPPEDRADHGPSAPVMLVVAIIVVVGGYFLSVKLKEMGQLQDCVMSGRSNCAPLTAPGR